MLTEMCIDTYVHIYIQCKRLSRGLKVTIKHDIENEGALDLITREIKALALNASQPQRKSRQAGPKYTSNDYGCIISTRY